MSDFENRSFIQTNYENDAMGTFLKAFSQGYFF